MEDMLVDIDLRPKLARKTKRWLAAFLDYFFYFCIVMVISYFFGDTSTEVETTVNGISSSFSRSLTGWPAFFGTIIPWFILLPGIEGMNNGQTLGKAIMSVRAVKDNGERLTMGRALARHIVDFVDYFPFLGIVGLIVASNNSDNKRVGDMVGRTIVVEA